MKRRGERRKRVEKEEEEDDDDDDEREEEEEEEEEEERDEEQQAGYEEDEYEEEFEEEFVLVELEKLPTFFSTLAPLPDEVVVTGMDGSKQQEPTLTVRGARFRGREMPMMGTALVMRPSGEIVGAPVTRRVVMTGTGRPRKKKQRE